MYDFLASAGAKYGLGFWKPGSGIIHQVPSVSRWHNHCVVTFHPEIIADCAGELRLPWLVADWDRQPHTKWRYKIILTGI